MVNFSATFQFLGNIFLDERFCMHDFLWSAGIRVQSFKEGQITMDIDFRWGGDPSIILGVEAALIASLPIQVRG